MEGGSITTFGRRPDAADNRTAFFATTDFRAQATKFGIRRRDRRFHMYILGRSGTGKSNLLETLIRGDIEAGEGVLLIDPHGDLVESIKRHLPSRRRGDAIYFNAADAHSPVTLNPLEHTAPHFQPLAASGLLSAFRTIWAESWGPRMEHILRHALLTLLARRGSTLADIPRLFDDPTFRRQAVESLTNSQVKRFWTAEYAKYPVRLKAEAIAPIQNKVGAFLSNPTLHRILTGDGEPLRLRRVMDEGKILLVNLAKGQVGEDTARLLGALLLSRVMLAALSRANIAEAARRDFYVYADEVHSYATADLASMLAELRKFRVNLVLSHQHLSQMPVEVRDALLGNTGTLIAFRLGVPDAELLAPEFYPSFRAGDLLSLPNYHIYLKLMIDGQVSPPFSAVTLPPA